MDPPFQIRVQSEDFDPAAHIEAMRGGACGAVVSFVGVARDMSEGFPVERITIEHYPGMTEKSLQQIVDAARARWRLLDARVIHRYGTLAPGERIVLVVTASAHRDAAFDACRYIVDHLKTRAPFWKHESGSAGGRWVEAKEFDEQALGHWRSGT
jgi:molybdopterin synthase catalytic subunit